MHTDGLKTSSPFEKALDDAKKARERAKEIERLAKDYMRRDHLWLYNVPITRASKE